METIKSNSEISNLFALGKRYSNRYVIFIAIQIRDTFSISNKNTKHGPGGRVAFIAGKKNGNAVWRNSAKRRMREIYRANKELLNNYDILMVAKPTVLKDPYNKVFIACRNTIMKIDNA